MGFADTRRQELRDAVEKGAPPLTPEAETRALLAAAIEWGDARSEHLDALCKLLREQDGTSSADAWRYRADEMRSDLNKFADALRSVSNPSEWAQNYVKSNTAADEAFVTAVQQAVVAAQARDYMVGYLKALREEIQNLETAWQELHGDHTDYQEQEAEVIEQVERVVEDAAREAQDLPNKIVKEIADDVVALKDALGRLPEGMAGTAGVPGSKVLSLLAAAVKYVEKLTVAVETQRDRFERYFKEEIGNVYFIFTDFRKSTDEFVDKFGYTKVEEEERKANDGLAGITSRGGTSSANQADAKQFVEAASILVNGHVNSAKNAWDEFVLKHKGKFFGPISPETSKALLDRDFFEEKYARLQAENLQHLVEMWRSDARQAWGVDLSGLPPGDAETYKNAIQEQLRDLDSLLRDPIMHRFRETMKSTLDMARGKLG